MDIITHNTQFGSMLVPTYKSFIYLFIYLFIRGMGLKMKFLRILLFTFLKI